jgi:hypothetical protein
MKRGLFAAAAGVWSFEISWHEEELPRAFGVGKHVVPIESELERSHFRL